MILLLCLLVAFLDFVQLKHLGLYKLKMKKDQRMHQFTTCYLKGKQCRETKRSQLLKQTSVKLVVSSQLNQFHPTRPSRLNFLRSLTQPLFKTLDDGVIAVSIFPSTTLQKCKKPTKKKTQNKAKKTPHLGARRLRCVWAWLCISLNKYIEIIKSFKECLSAERSY